MQQLPETSDSSAASDEIRYIANRRMAVGVNRDGSKRFVESGDEIVEVAGWKPMVRERYIQEGHVSRLVVATRGRGRPKKAEAN